MRRQRPPATWHTISPKLDSICRSIDLLDKGMRMLANRLIPFDDRDDFWGFVYRKWQFREESDPITLEATFEMVREIDAHLDAMDRDFNYVRNVIEDLDRHAALSDEIKPYLRPDKSGRQRK